MNALRWFFFKERLKRYAEVKQREHVIYHNEENTCRPHKHHLRLEFHYQLSSIAWGRGEVVRFRGSHSFQGNVRRGEKLSLTEYTTGVLKNIDCQWGGIIAILQSFLEGSGRFCYDTTKILWPPHSISYPNPQGTWVDQKENILTKYFDVLQATEPWCTCLLLKLI